MTPRRDAADDRPALRREHPRRQLRRASWCWSSCWRSRCSSCSTARTSATVAALRPLRGARDDRVGGAEPPALAPARADARLPARAGDPHPRRRAPAEDGRRAGRARVDHAHHRRQRLDAGHRRAPDAPGRRRTAAKRFVAQVPKTVNVGVMALSSKPRVLASPTRDRVAIDQALDQLTARGGTGTGEAITAATNILKRAPRRQRQAPAVGHRPALRRRRDRQDRSGRRRAGRAQAAHPHLHRGPRHRQGTITVPRPGGQGGTETRPVPPDPQSLAEVAKASGGKTYTAADTNKLSDVYKSLGSLLGTRTRSARSRRASPAAPSSCSSSAPPCPCAGSAA